MGEHQYFFTFQLQQINCCMIVASEAAVIVAVFCFWYGNDNQAALNNQSERVSPYIKTVAWSIAIFAHFIPLIVMFIY